jgi:cell division protein FtsB
MKYYYNNTQEVKMLGGKYIDEGNGTTLDYLIELPDKKVIEVHSSEVTTEQTKGKKMRHNIIAGLIMLFLAIIFVNIFMSNDKKFKSLNETIAINNKQLQDLANENNDLKTIVNMNGKFIDERCVCKKWVANTNEPSLTPREVCEGVK